MSPVSESAVNEPNEYGFAGAGTAPEPRDEAAGEPAEESAERTAVPDDDLTGPLADGLGDATGQDADEESQP